VAVPPDHKTQEYTFDRFGVRVPTVLVSPWVDPGSVFKAEAGELDHTSILKYLTDKHSLGSLGERTAAAATFSPAIRSTPSTLSPLRVGGRSRAADFSVVMDSQPPQLNKNQAALIEFTRHLELEMRASPADVGMRAMKAASGVEGEVDAAKERVRLFLGQS
jgi:phospholipase C